MNHVDRTLNAREPAPLAGMPCGGPQPIACWRTLPAEPRAVTAADLSASGTHLSMSAGRALAALASSSRPQSAAKLSRVDPAALGFVHGARHDEIVDAALARGLALCPGATAPLLRLHYHDQPGDERLLVATAPIEDAQGNAYLFVLLSVAGTPWLHTVRGNPARFVKSQQHLVFARS